MRTKLRAGLHRAVDEARLFHLWFHPSNFYTDLDGQLALLDGVLAEAAALVRQGRLDVLPMGAFVVPGLGCRLTPVVPPRRDGEHLLRRPVPDDLTPLAALAAELWGAGQADRFAHRWWWRDEVPHCWVAEHVPTGALGAICAQRRTRVLVGRPDGPCRDGQRLVREPGTRRRRDWARRSCAGRVATPS